MESKLAEKKGEWKRQSIDMENLIEPVNFRTRKGGKMVGWRVIKIVSFKMEGDGVKVNTRNCGYEGCADIW